MGGLEVGIVDVPGHEHFIKTMVAGATGIDGVIFVVAADDGIMPQTREHLQILTLLGVRYGLVALTKVDIVTPERVQAVTQELEAFLHGTFLEGAVICPLSTITGSGFDGFYKSLKELVSRIKPRITEGIFQMPVERAFSLKGYGTIISGIPASGAAKLGDELTLLPEGVSSRIRAIQVYGKDAQQVQSGQCAALNLPQIDAKVVKRGQVLTKGNYLKAAQWFLCSLSVLESAGQAVKNGRRYKFHTGTVEVTAVLYVLDDQAAADGSVIVQVRTDEPVVAGVCSAFILRDLSPMRTMGGGYVIEATDGRIKRKAEIVEDLRQCAAAVRCPEDFIRYCLRAGGNPYLRSEDIAERVQQTPEKVSAVLGQMVAAGQALEVQGYFICSRRLEECRERMIAAVDGYHTMNPQSPGLEEELLVNQPDAPKAAIRSVLNALISEKKLIVVSGRIASPKHRLQFDPRQRELLEKVENLFAAKLFCPPSIEEAASALKTDVPSVQKTIKLLTEQRILCRVEEGLCFHAQAIEEAKGRIAEHVRGQGQGKLESVDFKYLIDTTRKYAIPLLDYMDKIGFTRRNGNTRYLK
jgi:selenocysteine-specific elongation factor